MKCECGFQFSELNEEKNSPMFVSMHWANGVVCPKCGTASLREEEVKI